MNKIDELRNYVDNLRIKNELNREAIKRDQLLITKLKNENIKLKNENKKLKETNEELIKDVIEEIRVK